MEALSGRCARRGGIDGDERDPVVSVGHCEEGVPGRTMCAARLQGDGPDAARNREVSKSASQQVNE